MGKLSAISRILETIKTGLSFIGQLLIDLWRFVAKYLNKIWVWLRLRLPFLQALTARHLNNPATIFVDIAVLMLGLYILFGVTGAILIYPQKAESRFAEALSILYPLPAVRVENSFIWSHRFLQRLRFLNTFNAQAPQDLSVRPPASNELREQIMEGLIEDQVILLEAKKLGVRVSQEELDIAYDAQKRQIENFETKIKQLYGMSVTEFRMVLAERILKEKVKGAALTQVKVRHILTTSASAANEAKKQLEGGKDFASVAKDFSQDAQTKDTGGELGAWTKGELATQIGQNFEDAAFQLEIGKLSDPVETKYGFHVIQVAEKSGSNSQTYAEWYKSILSNYKIRRFIRI